LTPAAGESPTDAEQHVLEPRRHHYFACVASCGFDAAVARRANNLPRWVRGHGGYALSVPRELLSFKPENLNTLLPVPHQAEQWASFYSGPTMLVACANSPVYGGGIEIAPDAQMDDGRLDICHVKALSRIKLLGLFPTAYFGRHLGIRGVEYTPAERVRVTSDRPASIYADGEYVCETPVEIALEARALRVITPA
jgi:diacylglycerol kinase family enzyme